VWGSDLEFFASRLSPGERRVGASPISDYRKKKKKRRRKKGKEGSQLELPNFVMGGKKKTKDTKPGQRIREPKNHDTRN